MSRADERAAGLAVVAVVAGLIAGCVTGTPQDPSAGPPSPTRSPSPSSSPTAVDASPSPSPTDVPPGGSDGGTPAPPAAPTGAPVPDPGGPARTPVQVVVSWATWDAQAGEVQVAGYAADVVESGGTCTLTLRLGEHTVTAEQPASPDATTTTCGAVAVARDRLPQAGTWHAVVSYVSEKSSGSSPDVSIQVP